MEQVEETFNSSLAIEKAGGNVDLARELFEMLTSELPEYASSISELYQQQDYTKLCETVHKLHGATRYCGVPALSQKTGEFESALKRDDKQQYPEMLKRLLSEIELINKNKAESL